MSDTMDVGKKLVEFCRQGKHVEAVDVVGPNIVSIEPQDFPGMPRRTDGIAAVRGKNEHWVQNNQVHRSEVRGPFPTATASSSSSPTTSRPSPARWPANPRPWKRPRCTRCGTGRWCRRSFSIRSGSRNPAIATRRGITRTTESASQATRLNEACRREHTCPT